MINVVNEAELLMHDYSNTSTGTEIKVAAALIESRAVPLFIVNALKFIQTSEEEKSNNVVKKKRLIHLISVISVV